MNEAVDALIASLDPTGRSAAEISGDLHAAASWREYTSLTLPEFDVCAPLTEAGTIRRRDLRAGARARRRSVGGGANLRELCAPGGHVIVSTPFLVKVHELPMLRHARLLALHATRPADAARGRGPRGREVELVGQPGVRGRQLHRWSRYRRWHSLRNEPDFPVQVWAFARARSASFPGIAFFRRNRQAAATAVAEPDTAALFAEIDELSARNRAGRDGGGRTSNPRATPRGGRAAGR